MLVLQIISMLLVSQTGVATSRFPEFVEAHRAAAIEKWEKDIAELETLDKETADPEQAILFLGSSSIRRWETMAEDLSPWPTIRRGYGGAKFSDLAVFTRRLVQPHQPAAIAIFVANDISGKEQDKTPEEVLQLVQFVASEVREVAAKTPLFFFEITPTSSRFHVWNEIKQANALIQEYCEKTDNTYFIATAEHFLINGQPNDALFVEDKLHLNADGYQLWAKIVKQRFGETLGSPSQK
jgi:hypothetical protein